MGVLEQKGWVARPGEEARDVLSPICFDGRSLDANGTAELQQWHPFPNLVSGNASYLIKHVADSDEQGPFAKVAFLSDNWSREMRETCLLLKLRPYQDGKFLLDTDIGNRSPPPMSGWTVVRWLATKAIAPEVADLTSTALEEQHVDWITWKKGDAVAQTCLIWRVYLGD